MSDEAIYLLTKLKLKNYDNLKDKKISITYNELIDYTIKTLKLIKEIKGE